MGGEWEMIRIGDAAKINPDTISRDWPYPHIRYIDISSVGAGQIEVSPQWMKLSDAPSRAKRLVCKGDTVLSTVRPNRRSMFFASNPGDDWVISTGFAVLRPNTELLEPRFLYACVSNQAFTEYLITREKGAAYPAVSPEDIANAKIPFPPLPEQRAIAHILRTLDDKIELNRRMSRTLEEMARAIYKSWFVDFDPVRAKCRGEPMCSPPIGQAHRPAPTDWYLPQHILDLFPDRLVDSELGEIPEGWGVERLSEIVEMLRDHVNPLSEPASEFLHFSIPAFDEGQCPKLERGEEIKSQKWQVPPGVVLLSKLNPEIERVWLVDVKPDDRAVCSTEFLVLRPKPPYGRSYVYCLTRSPLFRQQIEGLVTGTSKSHQRAQPGAILQLAAIKPPALLITAFDRTAASLLNRTLECRRESRILAALRDALLPKLISGEIGVKDAECFLKERGL
jgi:type I restriction enzyme S subunit